MFIVFSEALRPCIAEHRIKSRHLHPRPGVLLLTAVYPPQHPIVTAECPPMSDLWKTKKMQWVTNHSHAAWSENIVWYQKGSFWCMLRENRISKWHFFLSYESIFPLSLIFCIVPLLVSAANAGSLPQTTFEFTASPSSFQVHRLKHQLYLK